MSETLISSFLVSDVSESLRSLTKNERMSESLIFLSKSLIRSFLDKKLAIRSEIKWANSQPCISATRVRIRPVPPIWYDSNRFGR